MNERPNQYRPTVELTHKQLKTIQLVVPRETEAEILRVHRRLLNDEYDHADSPDTYTVPDLNLSVYEVTELIDALAATGAGATRACLILVGYRNRLQEMNDAEIIDDGGETTAEWSRRDVAEAYLEYPEELADIVEHAIEAANTDWEEHRSQQFAAIRDRYCLENIDITTRDPAEGAPSLAYNVGDDWEAMFDATGMRNDASDPIAQLWMDWLEDVTLYVCRFARQERVSR